MARRLRPLISAGTPIPCCLALLSLGLAPADPPPPNRQAAPIEAADDQITAFELEPRATVLAAKSLIETGRAEQAVFILNELIANLGDPGDDDDRDLRAAVYYNLGCAHLAEPSEQAPDGADEPADADAESAASQAIDAFRAADRVATDPNLRARARFNLGHAIAAPALARLETAPTEDPASAIARLRIAAGAFRSVTDVAGSDPAIRAAAAGNVERLRRFIRDIETAREQQQQRQQQMQELADELEQLAEQQQQQSQQNAREPQQSEERNQEARQQQQDLSQRTQDALEQLEQAESETQESNQPEDGVEPADQRPEDSPPSPTDRARDAREAQQRAQEALEGGSPQDAAREQQQAAEQLREAAQTLRQEARQQQEGQRPDPDTDETQSDESDPQEGRPEGDADPNQPADEAQEGPPSPADELIEQEERDREAREAHRSYLPEFVPVERDW